MSRAALAGALLIVSGCGGEEAGDELLSERGLFDDLPGQVPAAGVVPYDVNSILYSDEAIKWRFVRLPDGAAIDFDNDGHWSYPDGTQLVKTFGYLADYREPDGAYRLLETRILTLTGGEWLADVFLWNDEQTDAERFVAGRTIDVAWIDAAGRSKSLGYRVPNTNQCVSCHGNEDRVRPLGPVTRQLNRDYDYGDRVVNQLDHWDGLGMFGAPLPPTGERASMPDPFDQTVPLDQRARAYLDANCAHCHQPGGNAGSTGLDLRWGTSLTAQTGICKAPVAAGPGTGGLNYVLVPGSPDTSIMVFRMSTTEPGQKMPELPTQTIDEAGLALIRAWIESMDPDDCDRTQ